MIEYARLSAWGLKLAHDAAHCSGKHPDLFIGTGYDFNNLMSLASQTKQRK